MKKVYGLILTIFILQCINAQATLIELQPGSESKDIIIRKYLPEETFDDTWLYVRHDEAIDEYRSLIEFDLSSITQTSVVNATMAIYCYDYIHTSSPTIYANRITESWTEETVSWITHNDKYTTDDMASQTGQVDIGWVTWDITDIVNEWFNPSNGINNYGIMLITDYIPPLNLNFFYSSDYTDDPSLRPKLTLEVSDEAVPEPLTIMLLCSGLAGVYLRQRK